MAAFDRPKSKHDALQLVASSDRPFQFVKRLQLQHDPAKRHNFQCTLAREGDVIRAIRVSADTHAFCCTLRCDNCLVPSIDIYCGPPEELEAMWLPIIALQYSELQLQAFCSSPAAFVDVVYELHPNNSRRELATQPQAFGVGNNGFQTFNGSVFPAAVNSERVMSFLTRSL